MADAANPSAIEAELQLLRAVFRTAPEAIVVSDLATARIIDLNDRAAALFGEARAALLGSSHLALSWPRQADERPLAEAIAAAVARAERGEAVELEWVYRSAAGEPLPCELRIVHVAELGRVLCRVTIADLRERRRAEAERARLRELEIQNREIREATRLKSEFLAAMSHELRTPLNAIIGFSELLFDGSVAPGSAEHHEFLGDILTSSRHLLRLINDVLDLAKVEAGKLELRPEPVALDAAIAEVAGLLRTQAHRKRIQVELAGDPALGHATLDPARFKQVLYNYLSNALKFTPDGGRIAVRTRVVDDAWFRLEVEDSGIGIAADQLGRLFREFEQLDPDSGAAAGSAGDPAASQLQGTGLGLALTRRLVEAQGGSVGVRSTPGAGSTFHAILPRDARADPAS